VRGKEDEIVQYIEPIFRFCLKRVNNRADAEDLTGEIILHVLDGVRKYSIESFDAWVWRVAHNRYARYCAGKNKTETDELFEDLLVNVSDDYVHIDESSARDDYETVFRLLHTLSSDYKNILVDYYIGKKSIKVINQLHCACIIMHFRHAR